MTKKEAFRNTLKYKKTTPLPYVIRFTIEAEEKFRTFRKGRFDPVWDTGTYAVFSQTNSGWEEVRPGYFKDYFGVIWNKTMDRTLGVVVDPPVKKPSLKNLQFPDAGDLPVYHYQLENNKNYPDHFHILSIGFTLFERAWSLAGMEELMIWMLTEPAFVHDLMDEICKYNISLIKQSSSLGGLDAVRFGDDWAGQQGLLLGKELWLEFIFPRLSRMCEAAREEGLFIGQHCCGKVDSLIPEMIRAGIHFFDPFQPEVMDVRQVFNSFYGKISFLGGLSIQKTLPYGSIEDVAQESTALIRDLGSRGGYIFSPSHALTADIPPENIETMLAIAGNQEQYIPLHHG